MTYDYCTVNRGQEEEEEEEDDEEEDNREERRRARESWWIRPRRAKVEMAVQG